MYLDHHEISAVVMAGLFIKDWEVGEGDRAVSQGGMHPSEC